MRRFRYPDCQGELGCPAHCAGRDMCLYRQPRTPFGLRPGADWAAFDRLRLGRI